MADYELVFDQGGNIGLKCPKCGQARWSEDHGVNDWSTGQDCSNCVEIKNNGDFIKEKGLHDLAKTKAEVEAREAEIAAENTKEQAELSKKKAIIANLEKKK